jgi:hypothetical protein
LPALRAETSHEKRLNVPAVDINRFRAPFSARDAFMDIVSALDLLRIVRDGVEIGRTRLQFARLANLSIQKWLANLEDRDKHIRQAIDSGSAALREEAHRLISVTDGLFSQHELLCARHRYVCCRFCVKPRDRESQVRISESPRGERSLVQPRDFSHSRPVEGGSPAMHAKILSAVSESSCDSNHFNNEGTWAITTSRSVSAAQT